MARWGLTAVQVVFVILLAFTGQAARADTAIRLLQSHVGNVNFVGTQETIRDRSNNQPCWVYGPTVDRYAALTGIPPEAEILSAQLYWAGSGYYPDFNVVMDGRAISAPSDRRYYSTTIGNNYNYFSGAADVTAQVKRRRNATYAFRGLTVDYNSPYCAVEGVLGGFSLLVIYSDKAQPFRMLNLYEGFQYMRYSGFTLNLSGFRVPDPIGSATGRVGHITWEGDATLDGYGENLRFNGYEMTDWRNPSGNQFNSRSNINGDDASYGIDFDAYTVGSPVIKSGQTTASTRYESGQDLVLLSAEIVALPNIPLADLSIAMTLADELVQGKDAAYTIRVSNAGPSIGNNPTVVTSTLPAGLTFVSGAGKGWACSGIADKVTCTNSSALASGSSLPDLTLAVRVTGTGKITTSVLVTGKTFDPATGNNTASVEADVSAAASAYVFTAAKCVSGLSFEDGNQTCTKVLPEVKAGEPRPIYITALSNGIPASPSAATTVPMAFALGCHNPAKHAGVRASYAGKTLPLCHEKDGAVGWSGSANITFTPDSPSAEVNFQYDDVGLVELFMLVGPENTLVQSAKFVSIPYELRFTTDDKTLFGSPLDQNSKVFAKAGVAFTLEAGSYTAGGVNAKPTPNFGKEDTPVAFALPKVEGGVAGIVEIPELVPENAVAPFTAIVGARATGKFKWAEAGVAKMSPVLVPANYLGVPVTRTPAYGRFIPHHFRTSVTQMGCLPNMKCHSDNTDISTAAYSKEPISVTVTAMADGDTVTKNYRGGFARSVTLSAWAGANKDQSMPGLSGGNVKSDDFNDGIASPFPKYTLPNAFIHTAPQATWSAPTSIYLRAIEATGSDGVTSNLDTGAFEGGVRIVSGRLLVPNAHGSERLSIPLKVNAQYWTGTNWELNSEDDSSIVDPSKAVFSDVGGLSLAIAPLTADKLSKGVRGFSVKATPAASGKADLTIDHIDWLPSTKGRLKFGTYKSPLIYLRERH